MQQREKSIPPQGGTRIPEALDRLIDLFTATNKPDEVKKWRAEWARYRLRGTEEEAVTPAAIARRIELGPNLADRGCSAMTEESLFAEALSLRPEDADFGEPGGGHCR
jgi:hypothetical protein